MVKEVRFYDKIEDHRLRFAVILARSGGKWVLCKHRERSTLEIPGGHREPGEDIDAAARRELHEETGAAAFTPELHSEIERTVLLDSLAGVDWTYPDIQPRLLEEARRRGVTP